MARPKPQILVEVTDKVTYKTEQVLASEGIWAVYFDGKPINLKRLTCWCSILDQNIKK